MCRKSAYVFLVLSFCLGVARADLTMVPLSTWDITGDFGDVLALDGYSVDRLIVGTSVYAEPPGQSASEPAEAIDDFSLSTSGCADGEPWVQTVFTQPVRIIFILEKNGNDSGTIQGLDAGGNPVGNALSFTGGSVYWKSTGYLASELSTQQTAFGAVLTSDIPIYGILITAPGIDPVSIMAVGGVVSVSLAPQPAQGATDVPRDTLLSWTPGKNAQAHDVYLGTVFEDVNDADRSNPLGVLVNQDQDANTYDPGRLEFGQRYYWRIDDVNAANAKVYKGETWSFEVEPFAYPLPGSRITATASSSQDADSGPEKTIDGSGLVDDRHSVDTKAMWLSGEGDPGSAWIRYDFDRLYKLDRLLVWNYNGPSILGGYGLQNVTIEYSQDGETWTVVPDANELAQASGTDDYEYNTTIDLSGVVAKSVRITANSNWGGPMYTQYGLSEVRFLYIPVAAREPHPAVGATGVDPQATLSWRAGREAASHEVYLGTNADDLAPMGTVAEPGYQMSVDLGRSYVWQVVEVNEAQVPTSWSSDIWSFSTADYLVVDDFESYNDEEDQGTRIYETWVDGWTDSQKGGSQVGYTDPTFVEQTIVHGGRQSMPLSYDNTEGASYSEAELPLASADWTRAGIATLVLYFSGAPDNNGGQLYLKINDTKIPFGGDPAAINRPWWTQWNVDLAALDVKEVTALIIGIEGAGATGIVYVDDIRLYASAPPTAREEIWLEAEAATTITAPLQVFSAIPGASGGEYIEVELGNNSTSAPPTTGGIATYQITVQGGTYKIHCRIIAPTTDDDSCWIRIQGATTQTTNHASGWVRWNDMAGGSDWQWDVVHSSDDGNQEVEWTMAAGTYDLEFAYREDGCLLDALVVTAQ